MSVLKLGNDGRLPRHAHNLVGEKDPQLDYKNSGEVDKNYQLS